MCVCIYTRGRNVFIGGIFFIHSTRAARDGMDEMDVQCHASTPVLGRSPHLVTHCEAWSNARGVTRRPGGLLGIFVTTSRVTNVLCRVKLVVFF